MDEKLQRELEARLDEELDDQAFWDAADEQLKLQHGEHARRWLAMLEDPDPEDLIFDYQRICRRMSYVQGYIKGRMDESGGTDTLTRVIDRLI